MPSEVDICNLALAHLGDPATVASINPPQGSAQASHCQRFYPIARDALLEMSTWGFATVRVALAQIPYAFTEWLYAYQVPSDMVNSIAVLDPAATDDNAAAYFQANIPPGLANTNRSLYTPQPYAVETDPIRGVEVILTNQASATLRYTRLVTDTSLFSPTFVSTLSYWLASYLAGPVIKGDAGMNVAKQMREVGSQMLSISRPSDANQGTQHVTQSVPWMVGR
jgi:hypothetical protein